MHTFTFSTLIGPVENILEKMKSEGENAQTNRNPVNETFFLNFFFSKVAQEGNVHASPGDLFLVFS